MNTYFKELNLEFVYEEDDQEAVEDWSAQLLQMPVYLERISQQVVKIDKSGALKINMALLRNLPKKAQKKYLKSTIIHTITLKYLEKMRGVIFNDKNYHLFENLFDFYLADFFVFPQKDNWKREFVFQLTNYLMDRETHRKLYPYTNYAFNRVFQNIPKKQLIPQLKRRNYEFTLSMPASPVDHFGVGEQTDSLFDHIQLSAGTKKLIKFPSGYPVAGGQITTNEDRSEIPENEKVSINVEDVVGFGLVQLESEGGAESWFWTYRAFNICV